MSTTQQAAVRRDATNWRNEMTTYRIEIKTDSGYALHGETTSREDAMRKSQDLAACGYDGRVITAKGYVSQEWEIVSK